MGKVLSSQQVRQMVDLLHDTVRTADLIIARPGSTPVEIADATRLKVSATSYIAMLESIPNSEVQLWFPVIKSVALEILKQFFE